MSKNVKIKARLAVLEQELGKSGNQLGLAAKLGNATVDGWTDNQIEKSNLAVEKFLSHHKINPKWWKTGEGEIFITSVQGSTDNEENVTISENVYRTIVEGNTEYVLIPRTVLKDTRLMSIEQIENDKKIMDILLDQNQKLMARFLNAELPSVEAAKQKR